MIFFINQIDYFLNSNHSLKLKIQDIINFSLLLIIKPPQMSLPSIILSGLAVYIVFMFAGFHEVSQGYVGIYKRFGILHKKLAEPGYHFSIPFVQQFLQVKVTIQTDQVKNVPCGTSNGTLVYFQKIQVVNKLRKQLVYKTLLNYTENYDKYWITDKIHHQINQFCSKHSLQQIYIDIFDKLDEQLMKSLNKDLEVWAPGIQILSVRVTKPKVPQRIRKNFETMERFKVDYFIAVQKQKVRVEQQITKQKRQLIQMQSNFDVKKIKLQKKIDQKKNSFKMAKIQAEMIYEKQKTKIQTQFLSAFEQAKSYPELYNEKYIQYLTFDALTSNASLTLGNKIPNIMWGDKKKKNIKKIKKAQGNKPNEIQNQGKSDKKAVKMKVKQQQNVQTSNEAKNN